jgi:hypothetical protein
MVGRSGGFLQLLHWPDQPSDYRRLPGSLPKKTALHVVADPDQTEVAAACLAAS